MHATGEEWRPPCRELRLIPQVMVEANEKGAFGLPSTAVALLSCLVVCLAA